MTVSPSRPQVEGGGAGSHTHEPTVYLWRQVMPQKQPPHIVIITEFPAINAGLSLLLSSHSMDITTSSDYERGEQIVEESLVNSDPSASPILFIEATPQQPENVHRFERLMERVLQSNHPIQVVFVSDYEPDDELRERYLSVKHVLTTPVTTRRLSKVLNGLGIKSHKLNCGEYKRCGREPDGKNAQQDGVCPAAIEYKTDGTNDGDNGGRACWAIGGTLCSGTVQGSFASKINSCVDCDFYRIVASEEGEHFESINTIFRRLRKRGRSVELLRQPFDKKEDE